MTDPRARSRVVEPERTVVPSSTTRNENYGDDLINRLSERNNRKQHNSGFDSIVAGVGGPGTRNEPSTTNTTQKKTNPTTNSKKGALDDIEARLGLR